MNRLCIIQISVPQFLGLFWKRGNKQGAIAGMLVDFTVAVALELKFPGALPWAYGLTSGAVGLVANLAIYVAAAYLWPHSVDEKQRVEDLFQIAGRNVKTNAASTAAVGEISS